MDLGFPPDVMHTVYLGVVKLLTSKWLKDAKQIYYISNEKRNELEILLESIKPPKRVTRIPRRLKFIKLFKAHEWAMWFYYYSPVTLKNILHEDYYQHYILLVRGVSLLTSKKVTHIMVKEAEECLSEFSKNVELLYGYNCCRYNVHLLLHLPEFVLTHGPLQWYTMYPFENFNMTLQKYITGSQFIGSQIFKRYARDLVAKASDGTVPSALLGWFNCGPNKAHGIISTAIVNDSERRLLQAESASINAVKLFSRVLHKNIILESELYTKLRTRNNNCFIIDATSVFEVRYFVFIESINCVKAMGKLHYLSHSEHGLNYTYVSSRCEARFLPLDSLSAVVIKVQAYNNDYFMEFLNEIENRCD
jgi:hypothetical protein